MYDMNWEGGSTYKLRNVLVYIQFMLIGSDHAVVTGYLSKVRLNTSYVIPAGRLATRRQLIRAMSILKVYTIANHLSGTSIDH